MYVTVRLLDACLSHQNHIDSRLVLDMYVPALLLPYSFQLCYYQSTFL